MPTITIEDQAYEIREGQNVLHAALSLGFNLPYFCWHPALGSVGACRQCAVKQFRDQDDKRGKLVMACMTPANDGTRISIVDPEAREFRASVIEWLMVNHPHDCPVCDEGGECHLQDMTVMTGHTYREFRFNKRTHRNQYLGPLINHEMNRCIACYRCVRFYRDYAGGRDLDVFAAHDHVYFGRAEDGVLQSEFSGNLVEVCPTGVFDDKTLMRHFTRKWDLQTAPSVCVHCSLGCNTIPGERYGQLRRIRNRYNGAVNGYFLCDRGRYGYEFVNSDRRLRWPQVLDGGELQQAGRQTAVDCVVTALASPQGVLGIGSPRASLEANFALRELVGADRFYLGMADEEARLVRQALQIMRSGPARTPTLHETQLADAVLILGEDVSNTAPLLALNLRQTVRHQPLRALGHMQLHDWDDAALREALQHDRGPFYVAALHATRLDDIATKTYRAAPDDLARLGCAVAHALDEDAPAVPDLSAEARALAAEIAQALRSAQRPLIVSGAGCGSAAVMQAAANVAQALCCSGREAELFLALPEANSLGLAALGGGDLGEALQSLQDGEANAVIVLENDLFRRAPRAAVEAALTTAHYMVALDYLPTATTALADVLLPAATFAESSGSLVNNEGRVQRFFQVFVPGDRIQESWRWLRDVANAADAGALAGWQTLDDVIAALVASHNDFAPLAAAAPPASFRVLGEKVPRQSARFSGRTAIHAAENVSEPKPPQDPDSPLAFSMEGFEGQPPSPLIARFWSPGWNSVQSVNRFQQEVAGPLSGGDPGVRLIEPDGTSRAYWTPPAAFAPLADGWLAVPIHHIFGSELLSMHSPGVAELAPQPYLALNPADAGQLAAEEGDQVTFAVDGQSYRLPLRLMADLPSGLVAWPVGLVEGLVAGAVARPISSEHAADEGQQR